MIGGDFVAGGGGGYHGDAILIGALGDNLAVAGQHIAQEGNRALGLGQAVVYVLSFGVVAAVVFKDQLKAGVGAGSSQFSVNLVNIELSALLNGDAVLRRAASQRPAPPMTMVSAIAEEVISRTIITAINIESKRVFFIVITSLKDPPHMGG